MSDEKRAELLTQAMEKLRERNPAASSYWIRQQAEALVEKKLGPKMPPPPLPDPRAETAEVEEEKPKKRPPLVIPTSGWGLQCVGGILFGFGCFILFVGSVLVGMQAFLFSLYLFLMSALLVGAGGICRHLRANTLHSKRIYQALEASTDGIDGQ